MFLKSYSESEGSALALCCLRSDILKLKIVPEGRIAVPETDAERKTLEMLAEKKLVDYHEGGYWLTPIGIKVCKKMGWMD